MDNTQFQTSFIPKKPMANMPLYRPKPALQKSISIFGVVAFVLVFAVGISFGGLYFYKMTLMKNVENARNSLKLAEQSFEFETISDMQLFDKRISASKKILSAHTVVSPFFETLNSLTIPSVQFIKFTLEGGADGEPFTVRLSGNAKDYRSIATQASVFNSNAGKYFKDVAFSNLNLSDDKDSKGYVLFDVTFEVDPLLVSYEKQLDKFSSDYKMKTFDNTNTGNTVAPKSGDDKTDDILNQISDLDDNSFLLDEDLDIDTKVDSLNSKMTQ